MADNFDILQKYISLQTNVTLDGVIEMGFAKLGYNHLEESPFENFALTNNALSEDALDQIEERFQKLNRKPAIYFETKQELRQLSETLKEHNYHKDHEDSWMFHTGEGIDISSFDTVRKVENVQDLMIFLETFDKSFQKDDPLNPYGELGEYLKLTEKAWHNHHSNNRLEFFIAFKGNTPVATSTLNSFDGLGFISNVGSIREVRGQGFGKKVTLFAVHASIQNKNSSHCLTTEEGTHPNEFYKRLGFTTKFNAICYIKS